MTDTTNTGANTGRAAFEKWEALGESGEAPWNLAHGAALIVQMAEQCKAGQWQPEAKERAACLLLLQAIGHAGKCIVGHCRTICAAPATSPDSAPGEAVE